MKLSYAAAIVAVLLSGGVAQAAVSPDDEAADVIRLTQRDGSGGVHVAKSARDTLSRAALRSADLKRVDYQVDRVDELLTVTYTVGHRAVAVRPYRFSYVTVAMADPQSFAAPLSVIVSQPGRRSVRIINASDDDADGRRCTGGVTATSKNGQVVTQTVPFSCLESFDHAQLASAVGFEHRDGGDVAYDRARRTRDLPLTAHVPPTP